MPTYVDVCRRMPTYADVLVVEEQGKVVAFAYARLHALRAVQPYADVC